jgi:hypothetical protein
MASGLHKYDLDPPNVDPNGIAEQQTKTAGNPLVLNGALCDAGTELQFDIADAYPDDIKGVQFAFDSAGDINTAVFTITGLDQYGNAVTEAVTGVTTTAVLTTKYYSQITAIDVTVATATNVFVGTVSGSTGFVTNAIPVNRLSRSAAAMAVSGKAGTVQFDLQESYDNPNAPSAMNWFNVSSNQTADLAAVATVHCTAVRLKLEEYTDGAELQFHVSYSPYRA